MSVASVLKPKVVGRGYKSWFVGVGVGVGVGVRGCK